MMPRCLPSGRADMRFVCEASCRHRRSVRGASGLAPERRFCRLLPVRHFSQPTAGKGFRQLFRRGRESGSQGRREPEEGRLSGPLQYKGPWLLKKRNVTCPAHHCPAGCLAAITACSVMRFRKAGSWAAEIWSESWPLVVARGRGPMLFRKSARCLRTRELSAVEKR